MEQPESWPERNNNGITFQEWLAGQQDLPEGFCQWRCAPMHWWRGDELGWAILRYRHSRRWRRLQWYKARSAAKKR